MEKVGVIGIEACISNTGFLLAEVYVAGGGHENIAQVPIRGTGRTEAIGHAYSRESDVFPGQQETAWKFHAKPEDGLALLLGFVNANNIANSNVSQALERARIMVSPSGPQLLTQRQVSSYAIGQSRAA